MILVSLSLSSIRLPSNGVQVGSQLRCVSCDSTTLDQVWPFYILCRACIFVFDHVIWYLWSPTQVRMDAHYNVLLSLVLHVFLFFYFLLTKKNKKNHVGSTSLWCCLTSAFLTDTVEKAVCRAFIILYNFPLSKWQPP